MFRVRPATMAEAPVIGELIYLAAQGHYPTSGYDLSLGGDRAHQIAELTKLAATRAQSWFHLAHFALVEADGQVVAGAAGFDRIKAERELPQALMETGWSQADLTALDEKLKPLMGVFPPEPPGVWTIENVAVLPAGRGRGFGRTCVGAALQRGRAAGFTVAKLDVFAGNTAAQSLYESMGFRVTQIIDHAAFRTLLRRGAIHRMTVAL